MDRAALDQSLARLDAALGATPSKPQMRTPHLLRGRRHITASNVSSILDGQAMDTSVANTESPFANMSAIGESVLGNGSFFGDEVTMPVPVGGDPDRTMDMTAPVLPAHNNAQVLFSEFVRILVGERTGEVEGGVWGEVQEYESVCNQQAQHIERVLRKMPKQHHAAAATRLVLQQLVFERNMWRLVRSLYLDRQCRSDSPTDNDSVGWLKSDRTVVTEFYDSSREVREAQLVVDWLEQSAAEAKKAAQQEPTSGSHVAWENTLRIIKAANRGLTGGNHHLVTSMDPDAPLRQGKQLHDLDQEDERAMLRCLMLCLRSGEVFEAQDRCIGSGQQWRAATMEGWKLHHDPNVTDPTKREAVTGNPYRDVWKLVAWRASSDHRLPTYERAMYGSMCGNLSAMLLVCQDWEDLLWAHVRVLVDQRVEEKIRVSHAHARHRSLVPLPKEYPEQRMSLSNIFKSLDASVDIENPYYIMCKHLILDDMSGLLSAGERWLADGPAPHLLRCLTHLLIVLRKIYRIVEPQEENTANAVLLACVKGAMERGDVEQVAWYTAMLPPGDQVSCYASFLTNICDAPQRRHALHLARTVGLDTHAIAATATAIIRLSANSDVSDGLVGETSPGDRVRIAGLDWLLFDEDLRQEALLQALAIVRTFLIGRKTAAANMAMDRLPSDTLSIVNSNDNQTEEVEAAVREYLCVKTFLSAQESFSDWFDHYHQQKPTPPPELPASATFTEQIANEHATLQYEGLADKWQAALDRLTKVCTQQLYNVLLFPDGGWLVDPRPLPHITHQRPESSLRLEHLGPELAAREPDRDHQMATLRSIYIPQVCSLLQNVLSSTNQHKECLQLADVVASEQHRLYSAFGRPELQRFLLKMADPSRHLLDNDKDCLGYPLR